MNKTPGRLDDAAVQSKLLEVDGWKIDDGRLFREFEFENFVDAFGFMTRVALCAERMDHHPDWSNTWNRVSIHLSSHDVGGLSERDFTLARKINQVSGNRT